jgi:carbon starvation protein CstA
MAVQIRTLRDYNPTDRRVLFAHHFAAIAGPGPLVGRVLAAQMGFLPGTLWIIVGVIFAGAVQDMVILFFSMRSDGKSALFMGLYLRVVRPGRVLETTAIGVGLLIVAILAGGWVQESEGALADFFTLDPETLVICLSSTASRPRCCPCGCCSRRATTSRPP